VSLSSSMREAAGRAPQVLDDSTELVVKFLQQRQQQDGGFANRAGSGDLYYTVFGLESLRAINAPFDHERAAEYLRSFGSGESLDIVHLCCLARCWSSLSAVASCKMEVAVAERLREQLLNHRSKDGGFSVETIDETGSIYAAFLALGGCQDLEIPLPDADRLLTSIAALQTEDGGFANDAHLPIGTTPVTAAAVTLMHELGRPVEQNVCRWLLDRQHPTGGFFAHPAAPQPDLLSTATALHALSLGGKTLDDDARERCLDFVDELWSSQGCFRGTVDDDALDVEYGWYGLLALGHL